MTSLKKYNIPKENLKEIIKHLTFFKEHIYLDDVTEFHFKPTPYGTR